MGGNQPALIENADLIRKLVHLDDASCPVGDAVVVAADRYQAVMADAAFEPEQRVEWQCRKWLQFRLLGSEGFRDDALGRAMQPDVGDRDEPVIELAIEVIEIAERAGQEEVVADVVERPLHLALGLGPIRSASSRDEAVVLTERDQRTVVDDVAFDILAGHCRLHAVVENLDWYSADGGEGQHVTAQQRLQILVHDEAREDVPGMTEHQGEQPDDPADPRLVGESSDEAGEVDLRLLARRCLKANLERLRLVVRPDRRHKAFYRRVGPAIAAFPDLAGKSDGGQVGEGGSALTQIIEIRRELARSADLTRAVSRQLEPAFDVFPHRLRVAAGAPGDRRDRQALAVKPQDHHQFSKLDHRCRSFPNRIGKDRRRSTACSDCRIAPRQSGPGHQLRNFRCPQSGRIQRTTTTRQGTLDFVDNVVDRSSGAIHARATVPNPNLLLTPGEFARVRLLVGAPAAMTLVPDAAVLPDQSQHLLMTVSEDGTVVPKQVQIGDIRGGLRVVRSGLAPNDRVIIDGVAYATPGSKVQTQDGAIHYAASAGLD
jgi:hypothetical protein